jgi:hypothetical protein
MDRTPSAAGTAAEPAGYRPVQTTGARPAPAGAAELW